MDKYIKLTRESFAALASKVSGRLRTNAGTLEVVAEPQRHELVNNMESMLRDLVGMRTLTGEYDENHAALEYIDNYLSERALHVKRFEYNRYESMVATTQRTLKPKIMFVMHIDVVPGPSRLFKLREKDGKYFGRGTFDMKFAIPPALKMIDDLYRHEKLHKYDFGLMITSDEEVGGFEGVERLIKEGYIPDVVVVPDGGDNWKLETFCKGLWLIAMTAKGKNAHGSRPWEGESANAKLIDTLQEVRALFTGKNHSDSTLTLAMIHGGNAINQVADEATANLDMRFGSQSDVDTIIPKIRNICKKNEVFIDDEIFSKPVINSLSSPKIASFAKSVQKVTGSKPDEVISHAGTDARHFAAVGVPCAIVRPPGGNLHGPGEWVSKEGFFQLKDIFADYVEREARFKPRA